MALQLDAGNSIMKKGEGGYEMYILVSGRTHIDMGMGSEDFVTVPVNALCMP